jgi:hypothetical protein
MMDLRDMKNLTIHDAQPTTPAFGKTAAAHLVGPERQLENRLPLTSKHSAGGLKSGCLQLARE